MNKNEKKKTPQFQLDEKYTEATLSPRCLLLQHHQFFAGQGHFNQESHRKRSLILGLKEPAFSKADTDLVCSNSSRSLTWISG